VSTGLVKAIDEAGPAGVDDEVLHEA